MTTKMLAHDALRVALVLATLAFTIAAIIASW